MNAVLILIALVTVGAAILAMSRRNLLHSVLLFAGSWAGVGAFFLWAGAEFAAFAQVLVYVGAISMVVLFAVLLAAVAGTPLAVSPGPAPAVSVRQIGGELMGPHAAALLVVGVLLTVALLGAVVLAAGDRPENPEDAP